MTKKEFTNKFLKEQFKKKKFLDYEFENFKMNRRFSEWKKNKKH
ncbi:MULTISPECIES: hypothetical protein [Clostridioides]|nr:hypothetical protein QEW_0712 [Clostridioides difficile CD160]MDI7818094.1 hypothetical protein [Clostridioides difficile]